VRKTTAVAGSAVFLVVAPGVVAGLVPWWLTQWQTGAGYPVPVRITGAVLIAAGAAVLLGAFTQFALEGRGTPAPPAPTGQLVVRRLYRFVRNPMYLAVLAVITGQALLLGRLILLGYAAAVGAAFTAFVQGDEQPALSRRYGAEYEAYQRAVPGWWPGSHLPANRPSPDRGILSAPPLPVRLVPEQLPTLPDPRI
jgi:protein-S-isoprenylcysteine O-methyltransferase Ste14